MTSLYIYILYKNDILYRYQFHQPEKNDGFYSETFRDTRWTIYTKRVFNGFL